MIHYNSCIHKSLLLDLFFPTSLPLCYPGMTKGKISAQCCHAAVAVVEPLIQHKDPVYLAWQSDGATKIAVRIDACPIHF